MPKPPDVVTEIQVGHSCAGRETFQNAVPKRRGLMKVFDFGRDSQKNYFIKQYLYNVCTCLPTH